MYARPVLISIHKALASLDLLLTVHYLPSTAISIHKALASLDVISPSTLGIDVKFQSTRLSRASTNGNGLFRKILRISIHKALASLDSYI